MGQEDVFSSLQAQTPRPRRGIRVAVGVVLALISALLLTLSFPPYNLGLFIWVGFIPMLLAQHRILPARLSSLAPAITIGGWLGLFLAPLFGGRAFLLIIVPLLIGGLSLLLDKDKRRFHQQTDYRWFVVEGVVGWVGLEMIRSFIPAIGTWAFVGYPLWNQRWLLQPVSVVGIYGLDLLIMLFNYALAQLGISLFDRRWSWDARRPLDPRAGRSWLLALAILLAGWIGLSLALLAAAPNSTDRVTVAAVQPDLPRAAHRDTSTSAEERLAILSQQTQDATAQGAQLVVWPEMALGFDPQQVHTAQLRALALETQSYIVIGYVVEDQEGFRNEATVLAPSGEFLGVYAKTHPMIASGEPRSATAGAYPVYDTAIGRLGTLICFDAHFTDVSRRLGRQGAQIIAAPSLFGGPIAELPHTQIVFRAIENRAAFVMADVAYNSAVVDHQGQILELVITPEGTAKTLLADVPLGRGSTLYATLGDWLGWLALAGFVFFAVFMPATLRRAARSADRSVEEAP